MSDSKHEAFEKEYLQYWKNRVDSSPDGSKVADQDIIESFVSQMGITSADKVLDLGCGYGRMYNILSKYTSNIIGIDVSLDTLTEATKSPYSCLIQGKAEETHLANNFIDKIITWATFDVVEQESALIEANRILKHNSLLLITGKNSLYCKDDDKAFIAERNAKLKDFPNHFTDVSNLLSHSSQFGFSVIKAYAFEKRGDFGENRYKDILSTGINEFYEYLLILKKVDTVSSAPDKFSNEYSRVAIALSRQHGFEDVRTFFQWHRKSEQSQNII